MLVAFLLIGGLILAILFGRWRRETAFNNEMNRLMKKRDAEVSELQQKLQLRSMEHRAPTLGIGIYFLKINVKATLGTKEISLLLFRS